MLTATEALTELLGCVRTEYAEEWADGNGGMRIVAQPGETMTADWCAGDCSMAYVRVDTMGVSSQQFPEIDGTPTGRTGPLAVRFHVGVARCVAVVDSQGYAPDPDTQTEEAILFLDDARRLRRAIQCCLRDVPGLGAKTVVMGAWTPMGPFGTCAGGHWPLTVRAR